mgnify:CR=1 FL=1
MSRLRPACLRPAPAGGQLRCSRTGPYRHRRGHGRVHAVGYPSTRWTLPQIVAAIDEAFQRYYDHPSDPQRFGDEFVEATCIVGADGTPLADCAAFLDGLPQVAAPAEGATPMKWEYITTSHTAVWNDGSDSMTIKIKTSGPVKKVVKDVGTRGQVVDKREEKYERKALKNLAQVKSGDLVEVDPVQPHDGAHEGDLEPAPALCAAHPGRHRRTDRTLRPGRNQSVSDTAAPTAAGIGQTPPPVASDLTER